MTTKKQIIDQQKKTQATFENGIKKLNSYSEDEQISFLRAFMDYHTYNTKIMNAIVNPSIKVQLAYLALCYMNELPCKLSQLTLTDLNVQVKAVEKGLQVKHNEELKYIFMLIENPLPEVIKAHLKATGRIEDIKNPYQEYQIIAVRKKANAIKYISNPSDIVKRLALRSNGNVIQHIKNPEKHLQAIAVLNIPEAIQHINNPDEDIQLLAVNNDCRAIEFIKNPTEKVQKFVAKKALQFLPYINNPSRLILRYKRRLRNKILDELIVEWGIMSRLRGVGYPCCF